MGAGSMLDGGRETAARSRGGAGYCATFQSGFPSTPPLQPLPWYHPLPCILYLSAYGSLSLLLWWKGGSVLEEVFTE